MPRGAPPSAWIGARPPNKPASGGEAKAKALPMRGSVARSLVPQRKARPGVANGSIRGAVAAQAVEEENHSPASGGDTQIAQPKPKRRGRPSSPDSASKSESSAPEGTSSGKEDSNSEKHTSGSEVEEEEVDYGGSSTSSGKEDSNSEKHTSGSEVEQEEVDYGGGSSSGEVEEPSEEQKENQQQGRPLAAQAEETEGEEEKEEEEEQEDVITPLPDNDDDAG